MSGGKKVKRMKHATFMRGLRTELLSRLEPQVYTPGRRTFPEMKTRSTSGRVTWLFQRSMSSLGPLNSTLTVSVH